MNYKKSLIRLITGTNILNWHSFMWYRIYIFTCCMSWIGLGQTNMNNFKIENAVIYVSHSYLPINQSFPKRYRFFRCNNCGINERIWIVRSGSSTIDEQWQWTPKSKKEIKNVINCTDRSPNSIKARYTVIADWQISRF